MNSTLLVTYVFIFFQIRRMIKVGRGKLWLHLFWDGGVLMKLIVVRSNDGDQPSG